MVNVLFFVIGIIATVLTGITSVVAIAGTPANLRGFYSKKYLLIGLVGVAAGFAMIVLSFFTR